MHGRPQPSVYAVAARNAHDIAAAVNFARENDLRLVVKGGGHSYQGTSNAPDSLLIWTRHMHDIQMHDAFVPHGCEHTMQPQPAVTVGAGTFGMQAYTAVTTEGGKYVQGGGCTTVGLAGLLQGGGFGSFSKHYGTAAASLLEAEVVTADGQIRIANACTNPDLFWALKGGGGGTFGVISKITLKLHDLPEYFCAVNFTIKAPSDDAYRRLVRQFVSFYRKSLFNDHWGEQARLKPDNSFRDPNARGRPGLGAGERGLAALPGLGQAIARRIFAQVSGGHRGHTGAALLGRRSGGNRIGPKPCSQIQTEIRCAGCLTTASST